MRYDSEHKQRTRLKVLHEAAISIRKLGPGKISVSGLMEKVGLTHGGFYAHFKSKDELIDEAISFMFDDRFIAFQKSLIGLDPADGLSRYIDFYLSIDHRDGGHIGCPAIALASDIFRMQMTSRNIFKDGVERMIHSVSDLLQAINKPYPEQLAISILSEMIGAMIVARIISDQDRSCNILKNTSSSIKKRIGLI